MEIENRVLAERLRLASIGDVLRGMSVDVDTSYVTSVGGVPQVDTTETIALRLVDRGMFSDAGIRLLVNAGLQLPEEE
jgi:hypothetical protein